MKRYGVYVSNEIGGTRTVPVEGDLERAKGAAYEMAMDLAGDYQADGYEVAVTRRIGGAVKMRVTDPNYRTCSHCGKRMVEGYCLYEGADYYCSDDCLHAEMTHEEYMEAYEADDAYWTDWEPETWGVVLEPVAIVEDGVAPID